MNTMKRFENGVLDIIHNKAPIERYMKGYLTRLLANLELI